MFQKSALVVADEVHGLSKSHAQITPDEGVTVKLDWLSFTLPQSVGLDMAFDRLFSRRVTDFNRSDKELHGYKTRHRWGAVLVLSDGTPEQGIHIDLSGQGVRQIEQLCFEGDVTRWEPFFREVFLLGGHFTRVDIAGDVYHSEEVMPFTLDDVIRHLEAGDWRGHWDKWQEQREYKKSKSDGVQRLTGRTVYIGSKASRTFLCMYDKKLERESKTGAEITGGWLRTEVRFKHERATAVAATLADGLQIGKVYAGVLSEYLNFLDPDDDGSGNVSRRAVVGWWQSFLGSAERIRLAFRKPDKGLIEKKAWLGRQVAISLAMLREYCGVEDGEGSGAAAFWRYVADLVDSGKVRLKDYHFEQIQSWRSVAC